MTYDELFKQIQTYTENTFPSTTVLGDQTVSQREQIDTFIKQAEQRIYNSVQFPALRKNVTGNVQIGRPYIQTPSDFLSVYSLSVILPSGEYRYLVQKDVNYIRECYPNPTSLGVPRFYAMFGPTVISPPPNSVVTDELSLLVGPTPDVAYPVQMHYFYYPESITVAADGRTWLGDNIDSVLLYGSLVEAYTYMKGEPDMVAVYEKQYKEALALAKRLGDGLERMDAFRNGQYRQPVV